jgi:hypothetical protein
MNKTDIKKFLVFMACSLVVAGIILFVTSIADSLALFYIGLISAYLGIDLATTLRTTNKLPDGEFKTIKEGRYCLVAFTTVILFTLCMVKKTELIPLIVSITSYSSAMLLIGTLFIGAMEGNKMLTGYSY